MGSLRNGAAVVTWCDWVNKGMVRLCKVRYGSWGTVSLGQVIYGKQCSGLAVLVGRVTVSQGTLRMGLLWQIFRGTAWFPEVSYGKECPGLVRQMRHGAIR